MQVAAIILVGGFSGDSCDSGSENNSETPAASRPGLLAGMPVPLQDALGLPVVHHLVQQLQAQSIGSVVVVSESPSPPLSAAGRAVQAQVRWQRVKPAAFWKAAEYAFAALLQEGVDEVILLRMGAYLELDVQELLAHHYEHKCRVTSVVDSHGLPLDAFVISANRRNDAAFLLRHRLQETRTPCRSYVFRGYVNRLQSARDFRALVTDAMLQKTAMRPLGQEIRPGVWIGAGARIHPSARIVAPAYIGERARILSRAVVTRCGAVEHHAVVAEGTAVENATVLPYTRLGAGLELAHAVAGAGRVISVRRNTELAISDPRLLGSISPNAPVRTLGGLVSLATFLPAQFIRGFLHRLAGRTGAPAGEFPQVVIPEPARSSERQFEASHSGELEADVALARRYGNQ